MASDSDASVRSPVDLWVAQGLGHLTLPVFMAVPAIHGRGSKAM